MRAIVITLLIQLSSLTVVAQNVKISNSVRQIVKIISKNKQYEGGYPANTKQLNALATLKKIATDDELVKLTNNRNAVISIYAFKILKERRHVKVFDIAVQHLNDKRRADCLYHGSGFIHSERLKNQPVANFFYLESEHDNAQALDSLILYTNTNFNKRRVYIFYDSTLITNGNHERFRQLSRKYVDAAVALSRFRDEKDIALIRNQIFKHPYDGLQAVEIFPSDSFKQMLTELCRQENKPYGIYNAIAVYKDAFAVNLLSKAIEIPMENEWKREQHLKEIYSALKKYNTPYFNPIYTKLSETGIKYYDSY